MYVFPVVFGQAENQLEPKDKPVLNLNNGGRHCKLSPLNRQFNQIDGGRGLGLEQKGTKLGITLSKNKFKNKEQIQLRDSSCSSSTSAFLASS